VPFNLQDGTFVEFGLNPTMENPIVPFVINRRRGVVIAPGRYEFNEWFAAWRTNSSAPLSFVGRWGIGDFYDGYKQSYQFGGTLKVHHRLNASINLSRNQIKLITGQYTTDLITGRFDYAFSTQAFVNALLQYNTDAHEWSSNVRFNIIHRPLSDFFFVYNERRDSDRSALIERAIVAKMTYLMAF